MRILQINASYKPAYLYGGPTMSVAKLSEQLVEAGNIVEVFTTTANGKNELPVNTNSQTIIDGVAVRYFKRLTKDHTHFSPALLIKLWKEAPGFDVIHIHAWWNLVSVLSALIATLKRVPVILSPRGTLSAYSFGNNNKLFKKVLQSLLGKWLLNNSYIHATSDAEKDELAKIIKPQKIFNVPNFVKLADIPHTPPATNTVLKLLFLSRITEKKGLDILLNALPLIRVPYHLTIAGSGHEHYVEQLKAISSNNLTSTNITWLGFAGEDKFDILRNHQLLVLPSYNENFGNVVIESLSVGTAVLITEAVGLAGYVAANQLGWICQPTVQAIGDAINDIANNHQAQLNIIKTMAPAIIRNDFDESELIQKYMNMYQEVINHGRL